MKILKQIAEIVIIFVVLYFVIGYIKPPVTITETVSEIDTIYVDIKDTLFIVLPADIDTVLIGQDGDGGWSYDTTASQTFQLEKNGVYKAELFVKYSYDKQEFEIDFHIDITHPTIYHTTTQYIKIDEQKRNLRAFLGLSGVRDDERNIFAGNVGLTLFDKFDVYLIINDRFNAGIGINYRF